LDCAHEAEHLAEMLDDERRLARVSCQMAFYLWWVGDLRASTVGAERALALADRLGDAVLAIMSLVRLALTCISSGEFRRAIGLLNRCVQTLSGAPEGDDFGWPLHPAIACRNYLSFCLASLGEFPGAKTMAEDAVRVAEASGQPYGMAHITQLGVVHYIQGNASQAIATLERGLDLSQRGGFAFLSAGAATFLGRAYLLCGRAEESATLLEEAVAQTASMNFMAIHPHAVTALGEAYLQLGRCSEATSHAHRALELSRAHGARPFQAEAMRLLGVIEAGYGPGRGHDSESRLLEALAVAADCGMRPLVAHCHLALGKRYKCTGKREQAAAHFTIAATMYREMEMEFWLEQAKAEVSALT
jgi:tetratricopeptide (TPR) repeat protein